MDAVVAPQHFKLLLKSCPLCFRCLALARPRLTGLFSEVSGGKPEIMTRDLGGR